MDSMPWLRERGRSRQRSKALSSPHKVDSPAAASSRAASWAGISKRPGSWRREPIIEKQRRAKKDKVHPSPQVSRIINIPKEQGRILETNDQFSRASEKSQECPSLLLSWHMRGRTPDVTTSNPPQHCARISVHVPHRTPASFQTTHHPRHFVPGLPAVWATGMLWERSSKVDASAPPAAQPQRWQLSVFVTTPGP